MGNMCCRRVVYSPNGAELDYNSRCHQQQQQQQQPKAQTMSNAYHNAGDDCAINELLEGRMDLDVILPDGRKVRLTVERRTPMMDLLVQAASATKISPGAHIIHVFGDNGKGSNTLHYKPSTPIGSLDTNTICIVPKKDVQEPTLKRNSRIANRPFEPTFRVQVHLPRNQLTVVRVSPRVKISELRNMVCQEKGLETCRYQLVRPSDPTQALSGDLTLAEYGSTELSLLSNTSIESNICNSTSHIMPYFKRGEDQKKKTGILRLLAEDANKKSSKEIISNGINSNHRFSQATKTADNHTYQNRYKPKKRRPAPPPPPPVLPEVAFHSRQSSSDSSGYHEATSSFLHEEHCISTDEKASSDSSGVSSLDAKVTAVEPPPVPNAKKRRAPPPPPPPPLPVQVVDNTSPAPKTEIKSLKSVEDNQPAEINLQVDPPQNDIPEIHSVEKEEKQCEIKEKPLSESNAEKCIVVNSHKIEKELKAKENTDGEPVTRVALVALNARIEQDVTQQEIASSIQAAFHSLDCPQRIEPSLLAIKQKSLPHAEDDRSRVTQDDNCGESDYELSPPEIYENEIALSADEAGVNPYPLQKSTAVLTLNLETKDDPEIDLETFLPPPTEFRNDDKESFQVDVNSTSPTPHQSIGSKVLKRSSSLLSLTDVTPKYSASKSKKNRNLQRSLSDLTVNDKEDFEAEQERLQQEYIKLQKQFIRWQQQLLSNHAMLREECIVPQYARTLRQSHSLPEGEDYSDEAPSSIPLVSRSLSYEPTKSRGTTLPRSTINIPSLELNSMPIKNGSQTLRSSKSKSYFKPPQVRVSTKSRQRLPPEIRKDGELDISDDKKMLSTILPSFESLRFISEHKNEDIPSKMAHIHNGVQTVKLENSYNKLKTETKQNPNKLATFPKPHLKMNNGRLIQNGHNDGNLNCVNENGGQSKLVFSPSKVIQQTVSSQPPPPPPLPTQVERTTETIHAKSNKFPKIQSKVIKKEIQPQIDPREVLMQEIRRFGGRTALRKISLDITS